MEPKMNAKPLDKTRRGAANAALVDLINRMIRAQERIATDPDFLQRVQARIFLCRLTAIAITFLIAIVIASGINWQNEITPDQCPSALPAFPDSFPTTSELAALRAWYQGLNTRDAVTRYLDAQLAAGTSSRAIIRRVRDQQFRMTLVSMAFQKSVAQRMPLPKAF